VPLDAVGGFVFDIDGTLVHRTGPESVEAIDGARDVIERIAASGRPFAVFTNGSHLPPESFAVQLRAAGLPVEDDQALTPLRSVQAYFEKLGRAPRVLPFASGPARDYLRSVGMELVDDGSEVDAVFVAHSDHVDFEELERAARSVIAGARLLTASYVPAYAGAHGPILSRGAMITAAIAKASSTRPIVVGKPSQAAVRVMRRQLGIPSERMAMVGDDFRLDVALGQLGRSTTVLVRSGISASLDVSRLPEKRRPDLDVATVAELLPWL
jgi:HAD superfamily hydrolase (TIGR01450 family)